MHSQSTQGEESRQRAEDKFKSMKKAKAQTPPAGDALRQTEVEKTARLRALRLAKEAADKDAADREAAAAALARKTATRKRATKPQLAVPSEPK